NGLSDQSCPLPRSRSYPPSSNKRAPTVCSPPPTARTTPQRRSVPSRGFSGAPPLVRALPLAILLQQSTSTAASNHERFETARQHLSPGTLSRRDPTPEATSDAPPKSAGAPTQESQRPR